jgi:type IV secretion system protein VirB10
MRYLLAFLFAATLSVMAQTATTAENPTNSSAQMPAASTASTKDPVAPASTESTAVANNPASKQIVIPSGTQVLLVLKSPITTKSARVGDGVYCQTSFPVTLNNVNVIPAGTYVKGQIAQVQRAGKIKGRAQILFHFTTLIFPNGYTIDLPGSLGNEPGAQNHQVVDKEGTVQADSQKGKDAGTVAKTGATGAVVGSVADRSLTGAGIGGLAGAAVGLGEVLFTRGQDVRIEQGTALEMVLERPLTVDLTHGNATHAENEVMPRSDSIRLPVPASSTNPK